LIVSYASWFYNLYWIEWVRRKSSTRWWKIPKKWRNSCKMPSRKSISMAVDTWKEASSNRCLCRLRNRLELITLRMRKSTRSWTKSTKMEITEYHDNNLVNLSRKFSKWLVWMILHDDSRWHPVSIVFAKTFNNLIYTFKTKINVIYIQSKISLFFLLFFLLTSRRLHH